jgi:hypothetical protein
MAAMIPVMQVLHKRFRDLIRQHHLAHEAVKVTVGPLTAEETIGRQDRQDFPLLEGKEVMVEAEVHGARGQAFTDHPHEFSGTIGDVIGLDLTVRDNRAVFIATLNAVMALLGKVTATRHCRNEELELCAGEMTRRLHAKYPGATVGLIGLQPAILDHLVQTFGRENVICTDLNPATIGEVKYGTRILNGGTDTFRLIREADVILATSSTLVNGTYDAIQETALRDEKEFIVFGVTGAGASHLLGVERLCFQSHQP